MIEDIIKVSLVTGFLALDTKQVGNFQISLPVISAAIIGWILSGVEGAYTGFFIGGFISLLWLNLLPIGTNIPPDSCIAGCVAVSLSSFLIESIKIDQKIAVVISILIGVSFGFISRWLEVYIREFNVRLSKIAEFYSSRGNAALINLINLIAILIAFLKGFIVSFSGIYLSINILPKIIPTLPYQLLNGIRNTYFLLLPIGLANVLYMFMTKKFTSQFFISFFLTFILFFGFEFSPYRLLVISLVAGVILSFIYIPKEKKI